MYIYIYTTICIYSVWGLGSHVQAVVGGCTERIMPRDFFSAKCGRQSQNLFSWLGTLSIFGAVVHWGPQKRP